MALKKNWLLPAAIFILAFLLYGNTIRNGYNLDDAYVAQNNPRVLKGLSGIPEIFTSRYVDEEGNSFGYRPMAMATFAIEQELWGQNPYFGHMINTMLYALCSMLLYLSVRKIFRHAGRPFALVVALLFLAHPIHTEVVASLKNRETLLSFLFSLFSLLCFLKWMDTRRIWIVFTGVLSFILAFLSKQDAVTFAAVIPLAMYYRSSGSFPTAGMNKLFILGTKSPGIYLFLASFCFIFFYFATRRLGAVIAILSYFLTLALLIIYNWKTRKEIKETNRNTLSWFFLVAGILLFFAAIYFLKAGFAMLSLASFAVLFTRIFETTKFRRFNIPGKWLFILVPMAALALAGYLLYHLPNLYLPAENKVVYHFENPQFTQSPGYSTWPLAFYTLYFYLQKLLWPHPLGFYYGYKMIPEVGWGTPEVIFSVVFHLAILAFAMWKLPKKNILSFAILYYFITLSIFTNMVIQLPGIVGERMAFFPSAGFCLAVTYLIFRIMRLDIGAEMIPKARVAGLSGIMLLILVPYGIKTITRNQDWKDYLTLYSRDIGYLANSAKANSAYAEQLIKEAFNSDVRNPPPEVQQQYLKMAVKHLEKTTEIDPGYKFAWNNLGYITYQYLGEKEKGIIYMEKAIALDSNYESARFNLAYALKLEGRYSESLAQYREAIRVNPGNSIYFTEMADVYFQSGNLDSAMQWNREAARLSNLSDIPYINMGNIYWMWHDTLNAIVSWKKAFELNPQNKEVGETLQEYFRSKGDLGN